MDIYATKSLRDFVYSLSRVILDGLKPAGRKALETFWNSVKSLQAGISFDPAGNPSFNLQLGDIHAEETTLDEIFHYLEKADRRVLVAIDEFQQIASYPEKNVEALLRTHPTLYERPLRIRRKPATRHGQYVHQRFASFLPKRFDDVP